MNKNTMYNNAMDIQTPYRSSVASAWALRQVLYPHKLSVDDFLMQILKKAKVDLYL